MIPLKWTHHKTPYYEHCLDEVSQHYFPDEQNAKQRC